MDYFDSAVGMARVAVVKYQATAADKRGTLFVNPGTLATCGALDGVSHGEALQVALGSLGSSSCLPWELASAHTFQGNTISSLGILVGSAPVLCQLFSLSLWRESHVTPVRPDALLDFRTDDAPPIHFTARAM